MSKKKKVDLQKLLEMARGVSWSAELMEYEVADDNLSDAADLLVWVLKGAAALLGELQVRP